MLTCFNRSTCLSTSILLQIRASAEFPGFVRFRVSISVSTRIQPCYFTVHFTCSVVCLNICISMTFCTVWLVWRRRVGPPAEKRPMWCQILCLYSCSRFLVISWNTGTGAGVYRNCFQRWGGGRGSTLLQGRSESRRKALRFKKYRQGLKISAKFYNFSSELPARIARSFERSLGVTSCKCL